MRIASAVVTTRPSAERRRRAPPDEAREAPRFAGKVAAGSVQWVDVVDVAGVHVQQLLSLAVVVLAVGSPAPRPVDAAAPLEDLEPTEFVRITGQGAAPLEPRADARVDPSGPATDPTRASIEGAAPLSALAPSTGPSNDVLPADGVAPLEGPSAPFGTPPPIAAPLGPGPRPPPPARIDPRALHLVRVDLMVGPVWRIQRTETMITTSVEVGRMHGLSGSFHASMIVAPDREFVRVYDFPLGFGVVARGRLGQRPLYGSVGLSAGILVHRAGTDLGVVRRVDPDFRLPIRFAWTAGEVGLSVALIQGFSVRARTYERRGVEVWTRFPYRIGAVLGLHFDAGVGRAKPRSRHRRREMP